MNDIFTTISLSNHNKGIWSYNYNKYNNTSKDKMNKSKSVAESLNVVVKTHLVTMSEQYNVYAKAILEMEEKIRGLKQIMLSQDFFNNIRDVNLVTGAGASINTNKSNKTSVKKENIIVSNIQHENGNKEAEAEAEAEAEVVRSQSPKFSFFTPKQKNSLFWCLYIIINGMASYEYEKNYFTAEQEFKVKTIERIKKGENKKILKENKISKNMIESGLMGSGAGSGISPKILYALSLFYNVNIFYVYKNTYYEMYSNENANTDISSKIHIIQYNPDINYYSVFVCMSADADNQRDKEEYIKNIKKICLKLDSLDDVNKPLRAITSYSLTELINIASQMNISNIHTNTNTDTDLIENKKIKVKLKTKSELYSEVMAKCL